ncbi:ATP-binding protein [Hahella aquimaris]|uniref:ATP-binding protein n=1 Tax=Hahella sp. HNIBRBA332 TaxID=3015983 RepID=UPI00273CC440|nr:ATP-binding protein [Hahella sp. HNIBRBA332]WLQ12783.1 ATP-binding protein [Hahella sp. HNIBRBA332]
MNLNNQQYISHRLRRRTLLAYLLFGMLLACVMLALSWLTLEQKWRSAMNNSVSIMQEDLTTALAAKNESQAIATLQTLNKLLPLREAILREKQGAVLLRYEIERKEGRPWHAIFSFLPVIGAQLFELPTAATAPQNAAKGELWVELQPAVLMEELAQQTLPLWSTGLACLIILYLFHSIQLSQAIERPLHGILQRLAQINYNRPARHLLPLRGALRIQDELDVLASHINQMLLGIDSQLRRRKEIEDEIKTHRRHLEKLVHERTSELVELNKKFVQQQFDAKASALAAKQARWEAEKANQDKTRFLAAASHDLRQPLHAMSLFIEALQPQLTTRQAQEIHRNLARSLETMKELFNSLLDISKLEAGVLKPKKEHFPLQRIYDRLEVVFRQQAMDKGLDLRIVPSRSFIYSDPHLLEQVLVNLVSNAIKYTESGFIFIGCKREGKRARLLVWDSGPGIPPDDQGSVFKEFVQLSNPERDRSKGLGLGLSIVKRTCQLLNHPIRFSSQLEQGTRFEIIAPLGLNKSQRPAPPKATVAPLRYERVLVIDDDASILLGMKALLESWQLQPILAKSIEEALDLCKSYKQKPDLIISDLRLQAGVTGLDAIQRMHQHFRSNIPSLLITGDTAPDRVKLAYDSPYPLLHKPIKPAQLRSVCMSVLKMGAPQTS